MLPYYLLMTLPGEEDTSYVLLQPYNPLEKPNMSAFPDSRLHTRPLRDGSSTTGCRQGSLVEGTGQVGNRIDQDDEISQQFTLWRGQGSSVVLGDMLVVPIGESVLYVQPVYLEAEQGGLPEFRRVVVVHGTTSNGTTPWRGPSPRYSAPTTARRPLPRKGRRKSRPPPRRRHLPPVR